MAIRPQTEKRFDKSSPVARYWLAQCEGFRVRGPMNGTVEEVVGSVDPQTAETLVVRSAGRRRRIPVAAVDAVIPASKVIVVEDLPATAPGRRRTNALAGATASTARTLAVAVAIAVATFARALHKSARVAAATGARLLADARTRQRAAADERRHRARASHSGEDRRLTRAAVLGVDRRGEHKP